MLTRLIPMMVSPQQCMRSRTHRTDRRGGARAEGRGRFVPIVLSLLLATPIAAIAADRLDPAVTPSFQSVRLRVDPADDRYLGWVRTSLEVSEEVADFAFHAEGQRLRWLELRNADGPIGFRYTQETSGYTTIHPETPLAPGNYVLSLEFTQEFNTRAVGLYRMEHEGNPYLFTQFQATDARKAFPCWDEPAFKVPYQLVVDHPEALEVVSNTAIEAETTRDGWRTVVFERTQPLPSYLLALAVGEFDSIDIRGLSVPGKIYTMPGQARLASAAAEMTAPILEELEEYFGESYPFEKLDLVAVPEFWPGAMENPGAVFFKDSILLVGDRAAPGALATLARITAHELAHMWFGDMVTMEWWDDLWLNESFADWMGDKVADAAYPKFEIELSQIEGVQRIMALDARPSTEPIRRPVVATDDMLQSVGLAYDKGKAVLGMMEEWLGERAFRDGVRQYLAEHAWGTTVATDLWQALGDAAEEDVAQSMSDFLDQSGLPLIVVDRAPSGFVRLSQRRLLNWEVAASDSLWALPVRLKYSRGGRAKVETVILDGPETVTDLRWDDLEWLLPNAGARGYYRWRLPTEKLLSLARESEETMGTRERIGFVGNARALLDAGAIGGDTYLGILSQFARDEEPLVVASALSAIEDVELAFVPARLELAFADYVRETFGPALDRFGRERKSGEKTAVSYLRPRLLELLGERGEDDAVREFAAGIAERFLSGEGRIDRALVPVALRLTALDGDESLFDEFKRRFESASEPADRDRYLAALGSFADPELRKTSLSYVLDGPLRPNELFSVPRAMMSTREGRGDVFRWVTNNYASIMDRLPAMAAGFMPMVATGCSPDRLAEAETFFRAEDRHSPAVERTLRSVSDQVTDCASLRRREGAVVSEYLRSTER